MGRELAHVDFLAPGTKLGGYELLGPLEFGGMAEIYLARVSGIEGFERHVVLKRMLPHYASHRSYETMFLDEARLMASLCHPNIVHTYDLGFDGDSYFFTMEYVNGADTRKLLRKCVARGFEVPIEHAVKIVIDAAAGLHSAHESRAPDGTPSEIVHRDVSPSNVLVSFEGCVKLIDFGVAKAARRMTETRSGTLKGKASYMSPEQCRAEPVDRRSDIFTLGILLYELSTTRRLFTGRSEYEIMDRVANVDFIPPTGLNRRYPDELERIVMKCLAMDPEDRYQTAQELQLDLEDFARYEALDVSAVRLGRFVQTLFPRKYAGTRRARVAPEPIAAPTPTPLNDSDVEIIIEECEPSEEITAVTQVSESVSDEDVIAEEEVVDIRTLMKDGGYDVLAEGRVARPHGRAATCRGFLSQHLPPAGGMRR